MMRDPLGGDDRLTRAVKIALLVILIGFIVLKAFELLGRVSAFTTIVIGAVFFAYLIYPAVSRLRRRLPLAAAIAIVYVVLILGLGLGIAYVVPALSSDAQQLVHNAPAIAQRAQSLLTNPNDPVTGRLPESVRGYLATLPDAFAANVGSYASRFATTVLPIVLSIVSIGALFVAIPIVAAYFIVEAEWIRRNLLELFPENSREKVQAIVADLDRVLGGFLRGQLLVALIVGVLVTILLLILRVQYAVLIGVIAGVLDVIPFIGSIAGWLPAFAIALFTNGIESAIFVTVGIVAINQLEGHVIAPAIVSRSVELTPLAVLLALLLGGELAGIAGLLLAVPVAAALRVFVIHLRERNPTS
jgi:predicted PurR-regulated permease PerM